MKVDTNDTAKRNRNRSWWQKRSRLERCGLILLVIVIALIIALIVALALVAHKLKMRIEAETCDTPDCIQTAAMFLRNMDQSVDPCDDFYEFSCGKFVRQADIPNDKSQVGPFYDIADIVDKQLKTLFEEPSPVDEIKPFTLMKSFYNSCLDVNSMENLTAVSELLGELGGWPTILGDSWDEENFNWQNLVYKFRKYGLNMNTFIKVDVFRDMNNSTQVIFALDQADLELPQNIMSKGLDDDVVKVYYQYLIEFAVLLGAEQATAEYDVKNMLDFRIQLANISLSAAERRDLTVLHNPMTINELQQKYPFIYWSEFFNKIINNPDFTVSNDQKVSVMSPHYLSEIGYVLEGTSKRAQANHAIFQILREMEWYLPQAIRNREQLFLTTIGGAITRASRWKECAKKTSEAFPIAAGAAYVRKYFKEDAKKSVVGMVSELQETFIRILKNTKWMDDSTKKKAVEKAEALKPVIGYPEEFLDDKKLDEYYSELEVSDTNMLYFNGNVTEFRVNKDLSYLGKVLGLADWRNLYSTVDVNAAYNGQENTIQMTAAVLQGNVFRKNRLRAINYGVMGFFIGHEITHAFDDTGKKFDKEGNLVNWWAEKTSEAFVGKTKCIIDQYSNYTVSEVDKNVDGVLTQGDNIADNGGVKGAYIAYNGWVDRNGAEPKLPGLNYTARQLFWISAANIWCSKDSEGALLGQLEDVHSPARFRVIGSFSNSDYFALDFKCPVGSKMNPKRKCQVW